MGDLILTFIIVCGSFQSYMQPEINRSERDLDALCGSESFMSNPDFVEFLQTADYTVLSRNTRASFEQHLSVNRSHYFMVIDQLGGIDYMENSTPDVLFEDLEDNN